MIIKKGIKERIAKFVLDIGHMGNLLDILWNLIWKGNIFYISIFMNDFAYI